MFDCLRFELIDGERGALLESWSDYGSRYHPKDEYFQPLGKFQKRIKSLVRPDNPI